MYLLEFRSKEKGQIDLVSAFKYHIGGSMVIVCRYIDETKEPHIGVTGSGVDVPAKGVEIEEISNMWGVYVVEKLSVSVELRWVEEMQHKQRPICSASSSTLNSFNLNSHQDMLVSYQYREQKRSG